MELSQPRPYGAQGAKPTHDFLSLYSPDPSPNIPGGYVTTHDFLQPLEQVEKEGNKVDHIMGTYNVGQISSSYMNQIDINKIETKKVPKAEGVVVISGAQSSSSNNNDENSNCSSYTGSGFTIWDESNVKKGKSKMGKTGVPWMTSQSSTVKFDTGKSTPGQQPNSPRSKHSATEQRRRSKINDRFTMLRGIMPHGDQKRDKASFLLEVIEYIQFLQEKVHKYEDSWNNKPSNMIPMDNKTTEEPQLPNGIISISTMYSQGISSALTQALKRSGVELSKTNISVQIDVGKRSSTNPKDNETDSIEESGEGLKRLKRS